MERAMWTDSRLDDLSSRMDAGFAQADARMDAGFARADARMDAGFARVDADIRELRQDVRGLDASLRTEIAALRGVMVRASTGVIIGLVGVIAAVFAAH